MGSYQTTFELPDEWRGRRVLLEFDGIGPAATVWLNTWLGVGVGVGVGLGLGLGLANPNPDPNQVWLNGREVGYTQDWALPAEFELTGLLAASSGRRRHVL